MSGTNFLLTTIFADAAIIFCASHTFLRRVSRVSTLLEFPLDLTRHRFLAT